MFILIIVMILAISAIWAGVGAFYSLLGNYILNLAPEAADVAMYLPYLKYGTMIVIMAVLSLYAFQLIKMKGT